MYDMEVFIKTQKRPVKVPCIKKQAAFLANFFVIKPLDVFSFMSTAALLRQGTLYLHQNKYLDPTVRPAVFLKYTNHVSEERETTMRSCVAGPTSYLMIVTVTLVAHSHTLAGR